MRPGHRRTRKIRTRRSTGAARQGSATAANETTGPECRGPGRPAPPPRAAAPVRPASGATPASSETSRATSGASGATSSLERRTCGSPLQGACCPPEPRRTPQGTPAQPGSGDRKSAPTPAVAATETETQDPRAQGHSKTVRLARIGRAVQAAPAMRAAVPAAAIGFRSVNPRQKGPDAGTGKDGTGEEIV